MYVDPLSQTPTYQKILKKGHDQGKLEGLQQALLDVVEIRFPSLAELARERIPQANKPDVIEYVLKGLLMVSEEKLACVLLDVLTA